MSLFTLTLKLFLTLCLLFVNQSMATVFTIPAGGEYSQPYINLYGPSVLNIGDRTQLHFGAVFDKSAIYTIDSNQQAAINKLAGFSDCGNSHTETSARFGWRWYHNQLEIFAFTHKDGHFKSKFMGLAEIDRPYDYNISLSEDLKHYVYSFNGVEVEMERGCDHKSALGYLLQPYFGGTSTAPQEIKIRMNAAGYGPAVVQNVFPNPTFSNGQVTLQVTPFESLSFWIKAYDLTGRMVYESNHSIISTSGTLTYTLSDLRSGIYIIEPWVESNGVVRNAAVVFGDNETLKLSVN